MISSSSPREQIPASYGQPGQFQHLLLTRFNVLFRNTSIVSKGLDEQWLLHRMDLFERFCFPSVAAQSNRNFRWVLVLHPRTPQSVRQSLDRLSDACPMLTIHEAEDCSAPVLGSIVRRYTTAEFVITSRLDNDDAIAVNFVESVQAAFRPTPFEFINFPNIAMYDLGNERFLRRTYLSNPYLSLIEACAGEVKTVLGFNHAKVKKRFEIRNIYTRTPMALTVVHDRNLSSTAIGRITTAAAISKHFEIKIAVESESNEPILKDHLLYWRDILLDFLKQATGVLRPRARAVFRRGSSRK